MAYPLTSATYVGLGVIGSHALPALVRSCPHLQRITVVDKDICERRNLESQVVGARDVGRPKVDAIAAAMQRINPALEVDRIAAPVEQVPLARLRADVIATGLDNRAARVWINRAARRLGVAWVDAGVRAEGRLARVDVFEPAPQAPCFECGWGRLDYASVETSYPCDPPAAPVPTGAPAYLGALAASLQVGECHKLLTGDRDRVLFRRQVLVDIAEHRHYLSARRQDPECRFDHGVWAIAPLAHSAGAITLRRALGLGGALTDRDTRLRVHGHPFVSRLLCPHCGGARPRLHLAHRLTSAARRCPRCGGDMVASGMDTLDTLSFSDADRVHRRTSLFALGLRAGDVFSVERPAGGAHFEIGGR